MSIFGFEALKHIETAFLARPWVTCREIRKTQEKSSKKRQSEIDLTAPCPA